ncbi:hypothetical protein HA402_015016 [Bradysia odoriphaga]|nr:hypothetical protein HA402_015016 [Bradysia odoriphaga]
MILKCVKCGILIICFFMVITNFAVHSAIVTETALKASLHNETRSIYNRCSDDDDCKGNKQYCNFYINLCECQPFFEYSSDTINCSPCPLEGEQCMSCCSNSNLKCYHGVCTRCLDDYYECDNTPSAFMNASQIALIAALIMGAAALATLLYRICTKPTYFGRSRRLHSGRNAEASESDFQRVARTSLSSIQIRVLSRLRDRPPKYETQHNYDMRIQRQEEEIQRTNDSSVNISTISALSAEEHAPPSYDGSKESVHESPPPYSDTGHDVLPDILVGQIESTSRSNENTTISIISSGSPGRDVISENRCPSDNKEDKTVHM